MGYWICRHEPIFHQLPAAAIDLGPLRLPWVASAGACLGFLCGWNAPPAPDHDGGHRLHGAFWSAAGGLCLLLNLELLLLIIGGLFVMGRPSRSSPRW